MGGCRHAFIEKNPFRSPNSQYFPKERGAGLESVAKGISENGVAVLKLMLQYDAERRISARRLIDHAYFKDLRFVLFLRQKKNVLAVISKLTGGHSRLVAFEAKKKFLSSNFEAH